MKLTVVVPVYNELYNGNLIPFIENISKVGIDNLIVLDDGSIDGSYGYLKVLNKTVPFNIYVYRNSNNSLLSNGQSRWYFLNKKAQEISDLEDWIYVASCDVLMSRQGFNYQLKNWLTELNTYHHNIRKASIPEAQLWRSKIWYRTGGRNWQWWINNGEYRLWKNLGQSLDKYLQPNAMLHRAHHFPHIEGEYTRLDIMNLHYAFSTKEKIIDKFRKYIERAKNNKFHDPVFSPKPEDCPPPENCWAINSFKILQEFELQLEKVKKEWFSEEDQKNINWEEPIPTAIDYSEIIGKYCGLIKEIEYREYFNKIMGEKI